MVEAIVAACIAGIVSGGASGYIGMKVAQNDIRWIRERLQLLEQSISNLHRRIDALLSGVKP